MGNESASWSRKEPSCMLRSQSVTACHCHLKMSSASSKWAWFTSNLYTVVSMLVEALEEPPCLLRNCL